MSARLNMPIIAVMDKQPTLFERLKRILAKSPEAVFVRAEFSELGDYRLVGKALRSAIKNGLICRVGYGVYVKARPSVLTGAPVPEKTLVEIAFLALGKLGVRARLGKAAKEYAEGKTTQMPMATVLNVGKSRVRRHLSVGMQTVRYEREKAADRRIDS